MPRRSNPRAVRQLYENAGFIVPDDFEQVYRNQHQRFRVYDIINEEYINLSVQTLKKHIDSGRTLDWSMLPFYQPMPLRGVDEVIDLNQNQNQNENTSFQRWLARQDEDLRNSDIDYAMQIFNQYKSFMRSINSKHNFEHVFQNLNGDSYDEILSLVIALKDSAPNILRKSTMVLTLYDRDNSPYYYNINATTTSTLLNSLLLKNDEKPHDSTDAWIFNDNYSKFTLEFNERAQGRNVAAGFFPFINKSDYDLTKYGIYDSIANVKLEPCIITALRNSNVFNENEMNEIESMVSVRSFPQQELKTISSMFNVNIYVRKYHENGKNGSSSLRGRAPNSHVEFGDKGTRSIKLMIYKEHYMIYENISGKMSNYSLIKKLISDNLLIPMNEKELDEVFSRTIKYDMFKKCKPYNNKRKITIPDKAQPRIYTNPGIYLFGYKPEADEINQRLNELQDFVDSLHLRKHINVTVYKKFSQLMLKIMYEYGCFDNVNEFSGVDAKSVRDSLIFPKRELKVNSVNEKVYYVDFNGAYTSFMNSIPTDLKFTSANTKIKSLIATMYEARLKAKSTGNDKLAKTIKFLMNSCYGASITKPKIMKTKYSTDISATIRQQGELVSSYDNTNYVRLINPLVPHYSFPQFAKSILDGFNAKVNEIKSLCNVLYQNCDAFVINENDFNKLNSLGFIHPTELGKLKVEHVFTSMEFKNKTKWFGVNEDGTIFHHGL